MATRNVGRNRPRTLRGVWVPTPPWAPTGMNANATDQHLSSNPQAFLIEDGPSACDTVTQQTTLEGT